MLRRKQVTRIGECEYLYTTVTRKCGDRMFLDGIKCVESFRRKEKVILVGDMNVETKSEVLRE